MFHFARRAAIAAALPAFAAVVLLPIAAAQAGTNPTGDYSVTPAYPSTPQGAHFTALYNPSNYDVRAAGGCSDGATVYGSFHTGTGTSSNAPYCSSGGHGHLVNAYKQWRLPPNTQTVSCWVLGVPRNGTC
jgi:hypothetical protein